MEFSAEPQPFEPCSLLLAKIKAVSDLNDTIINKISERFGSKIAVPIGYTFFLRDFPKEITERKRQRSSSRDKDKENDKSEVDENVKPLENGATAAAKNDTSDSNVEEDVLERWEEDFFDFNLEDEVTSGWRGRFTLDMREIPDVFNDKLNWKYDDWESLLDLQRKVLKVAQKYELFGESPKASESLRDFLSNLETIQLELGGIEETLTASDLSRPIDVAKIKPHAETFQKHALAAKEDMTRLLENLKIARRAMRKTKASLILMYDGEMTRQGYIADYLDKPIRLLKHGIDRHYTMPEAIVCNEKDPVCKYLNERKDVCLSCQLDLNMLY